MNGRANRAEQRELTNLIIPTSMLAIVVTLATEIKGPDLSAYVITTYALILGTYLGCILGCEYLFFNDLHRLKSMPVDALLVIATFVCILQVSRTAGAIDKTLFWLGGSLATLLVWEYYTTRCGYSTYFRMRPGADRFSILDYLRFPRVDVPNADRNWHWCEYKYWMLLDATLLFGVAIALAGSGKMLQLVSLENANLVVAGLGIVVAIVNSSRYALIFTRIRSLRARSSKA